MREQALPFLRKCVHPMDDDGAPLSDNFLMAEILRYGICDAYKENRISRTLSFPEMLPICPKPCCGCNRCLGARRAGG